MNAILQRLASFFELIPDALRPWRRMILGIFVAVTVVLAFGLQRFQLDTSFDAWLSDDDPAVQALDDFRRQFGSDDGLFLVYRAADGDVFSPHSLSQIRKLTNALDNWQDIDAQSLSLRPEVLENLKHITRVQSLSNTRYQASSDDTLESLNLLPESGEITHEIAETTRKLALEQRNLRLLMFSDKFQFGALVISTDFGAIPIQLTTSGRIEDGFDGDALDVATQNFSIDFDVEAEVRVVEFEDTKPNTYIGFMDGLKSIYGLPEYSETFEFFPIGTAGMMDYGMQTMVQSGVLVVVAIMIIILLLYTLFHTGSAVVWPVVAVASSCIWIFGAMSWMDIPSTQLAALTVMLVLAVGIADCVHVMSEYLFFKREGQTHEVAIKRSFEKTGVPILLTTVTTMAGMLAIAFGGVGQFVTFGVVSALGVFSAFVFTVVVLPVLLEFWHPNPVTSHEKPTSRWSYFLSRPLLLILMPLRAVRRLVRRIGLSWLLGALWLQPLLDQIPAFSYRMRYPIVALFFGIFVICGYGATKVHIDSNVVKLFKKNTPLRTAYEIVDKHMAGTGSMEVMLNFRVSDALSDVRVLQAVEAMQVAVMQRYGDYIMRTSSLADLVKATNQTMNNDDPAFYTIPDSSRTVSQLLFLFNSSNPGDRRAVVSDDYSQTHVTIQLRNAGSHEYGVIFADIENVIASHFEALSDDYPNWQIELTGTFALIMRMADVISNSQLKSLTLAIVIISALLMVTLGSVQGGLLALIPNILPAVLTFGLMGLLGVSLDADTLMIAPLIIGIAVDDTIHFVTHYRMALARRRTATEALIQTVKEVGQAVTFTSMVLGLAFLMLSFSNHLGIAKVGIFGSLAIFVALLCDLLFLPALIYIFQPKFGVKDAGIAHFKEKGA